MTQPMSFGSEKEMTDEQRLLVHVRTVLCGTECFPCYEVDNIVRRFRCGVSAAAAGKMTTWVPATSLQIIIMGSKTLGNIVLICKTGTAYSMSLALEIPPLNPGVSIVANCTMNRDETFRVLLYDAENLYPETVDGVDCTSVERYDRLRHFFPRYFECNEAVRSVFVLQWVGFYEHAVDFLAGKIDVGHSVGGLVSTTDNALQPTRPVQVKIPEITIKKFNDTRK
jgi:hypothetical protein